jgi:hypothetical protein
LSYISGIFSLIFIGKDIFLRSNNEISWNNFFLRLGGNLSLSAGGILSIFLAFSNPIGWSILAFGGLLLIVDHFSFTSSDT